jgi:RNA polymerase sigma-70 factor (ECF subfamily)
LHTTPHTRRTLRFQLSSASLGFEGQCSSPLFIAAPVPPSEEEEKDTWRSGDMGGRAFVDKTQLSLLWGANRREANLRSIGNENAVAALTEWDVLEQRRQIIELYDDLRPALQSYLSSLHVSSVEADDTIQEVFYRLFRFLSSGNQVNNVRGWIFRAAHNLAMDSHRKVARAQTTTGEDSELLALTQADPAMDPEESFLHDEKLRRLQAAMQKLTPQQRRCIQLRVEGMQFHDIAEVLGVTKQRAAVLLRRSLVRLAALCE